MNHFTSLLGATVGRFLMSLFPPVPQFSGRQAVTFHHQRDFIFFRRHRYIFQEVKNELENAEDETSSETATTVAVKPTKMTVTDKVRLQEIGPRFTLKLLLVQKGLPTNVDAPILWQRKKNLSTRASIHL